METFSVSYFAPTLILFSGDWKGNPFPFNKLGVYFFIYSYIGLTSYKFTAK
jgi:hypothetical protein